MTIVKLQLQDSKKKINELLKDDISSLNKQGYQSYWDGFVRDHGREKIIIDKELFIYENVSIPISKETEEFLEFNFSDYKYYENDNTIKVTLEFSLELFIKFSLKYPELAFIIKEEPNPQTFYRYTPYNKYSLKNGEIKEKQIDESYLINKPYEYVKSHKRKIDPKSENNENNYMINRNFFYNFLEIDKPELMLLIDSNLENNIINFYYKSGIPTLWFSNPITVDLSKDTKTLNINSLSLEKRFNIKKLIHKSKELIKSGAENISINFLDTILDTKERILYFNSNKNLGIDFVENSEKFITQLNIKLIFLNLYFHEISSQKFKSLVKDLKELVSKFNIKIIASTYMSKLTDDYDVTAEFLKNEIYQGRFDSVLYNTQDKLNIALRRNEDNIDIKLI